jgi:DNA-binding NtrC family response regulator
MNGVVLLIDASADAARIHRLLQHAPDLPRVVTAGTLATGLQRLRAEPVCCVVTDLTLPDARDALVLQALRRSHPRIPLVVATAQGNEDLATMALKAGAADYVRKQPEYAQKLLLAIRDAIGRSLVCNVEPDCRADTSIAHATPSDGMTFLATGEMQSLLGSIDRAARSNVSILIEGETGTGKELVARLIHRRGPRRSSPFIAQNCAALAESLLETELFGHLRGAFTGAEHDRRGLFVEAGEGVVFLDEIAEAPASVQAKLLRVLQNSEVKAVGADRSSRVRSRIVAATNRRLEDEVAAGRFRDDLYYRLSVFPIRLRPLRHRVGEIPMLAKHFLERHQNEERRELDGFAPSAIEALQRYPWPGNVRELEHEVHRLVLSLPQGRRVYAYHLAPRIQAAAETCGDQQPLRHIVRNVELAVIRQRLREHPTKASAARSLGLTREALYDKIRRLEAAARS